MQDLIDYVSRQQAWSAKTFGDGSRTVGITEHIKKEIEEIRQDPKDLSEWIDIVILGLDGAWRAGHTPEEIAAALEEKQRVNMARKWPTTSHENLPTEHIRE